MEKPPDSGELIVKADFFARIDIDDSNLKRLQTEVTKILRNNGYRLSDSNLDPFAPVEKTLEFTIHERLPTEEQDSLRGKLRGVISKQDSTDREKLSEEEFLSGLERVRDDIPFRYLFHFSPYYGEEVEGYDIEVESTPCLLQKYRQLNVREGYEFNVDNIIRENRREIKRIMGKLGLEPIKGPMRVSEYESTAGQNNSTSTELFNQHIVTARLQAITDPNEKIHRDFRKAVAEFNEGEYEDTIRDIGRASEALIDRLCRDIYNTSDIPSSAGSRINKISNTESGLPAYIIKSLSPVWWLRNKTSHPTGYEVTKSDAHYSLLSFQIAVEKYVDDFLEIDITE